MVDSVKNLRAFWIYFEEVTLNFVRENFCFYGILNIK